MIKVMQVLTDTNIGGAGIWLLNFLKTYDRTLIDMTVVLPHNSMLRQKAEMPDVRIIEADGIADSSFSIKGVINLYNIFKAEKPDIIHTHASLSARIAAKLNKICVVHTRHCIEEEKTFLIKIAYGFINNLLSDRVIGVSKAVCANLEADGISPQKLRLVYNGIFPLNEIDEQKKQSLKRKYNIDSNKIIVGIVARLEPVKNHELFLETAKVVSTVCPDTVFMIVGDGSLKKELKQKANNSGIGDKVIFTGYINDVNDIMNIIDIHVLTSCKEALSISLIEAMSLSKPVVSTNSGGPSEVIENGRSGILTGVDDEVNLTMAIIRLIQRKDIREEFGIAGRRIVNEKFLAQDMARSIEKIYKELV